MSKKRFQPDWPSLLVIAALVAVAIALWPTLSELVALWGGVDTYTHGPLLFLVSLWLIWRERPRLAATAWRPCWWFILPLALIAILSVAPMTNLRLFILPASAVALVGLIAGVAVARIIAIPVLLIHFALPGWGFCLPFLLGWTTAVVTFALDIVGIPALIEQQYVTIPAGRFVIEEGCAGMKYFVAGGALAAIFAFLYVRKAWRAALMVGAGFAVAIVANWVRVFGVIVAGHMTNMQSGLIDDHEAFGWVVFALALLPLFWFGGRLARDNSESLAESVDGRVRKPVPMIAAALAGVAILATAPVLARSVPAVDYRAVALPDRAGRFVLTPGQPLWRPALTGAVQRMHGRYDDGASRIRVSIGLYAGGNRTELVNDYENFEYMRDWRTVSDAIVATGVAHGEFRVRERELSHGRLPGRLTWHWYHVGGIMTPNRNLARLFAMRSLFTVRHDAAQVVLTADCETDCISARAALRSFVVDALPDLDLLLASAGKMEDSE